MALTKETSSRPIAKSRESIKIRTFLYPRPTPEPSAITGQHCPFPRPIRKPYPTQTLKEKPGAWKQKREKTKNNIFSIQLDVMWCVICGGVVFDVSFLDQSSPPSSTCRGDPCHWRTTYKPRPVRLSELNCDPANQISMGKNVPYLAYLQPHMAVMLRERFRPNFTTKRKRRVSLFCRWWWRRRRKWRVFDETARNLDWQLVSSWWHDCGGWYLAFGDERERRTIYIYIYIWGRWI